MRHFLKEFWVEVAFLFIAIVVILLSILHVNVLAMFSGLVNFFWDFLAEFSFSDYVRIVLVLMVGTILAWRACRRFTRSERYLGDQCPKCGSPLKRVRRVRRDRLLSKILLIPLHRYCCADSVCGWIGLKKPGRHQKNREEEAFEVRDSL